MNVNRRIRNWVRVAVGVIIVLAVLLVPRSETEIHKRRCQAAWDGVTGKSFVARVKGLYHRLTKTTPSTSYAGEWRESRQALIDMGYLVQQRFAVSDAAGIENAFRKAQLDTAFVEVDGHRDNRVTITAPRSEMTAVSNAVRKIEASLKEGDAL